MTPSPHYLIIGNGAAGLSAAEIIRRRDPAGRVTVVSNEPHLFYSRPGIAYYLTGQVSGRQLISRSRSFYRDNRIYLHFGHVSRLDLRAQQVHFRDGPPLGYDVLLLATGAAAVPPPFPGGDLDGVITFDTLDDASHAIRLARRARSAVVVGGGITAMELAEGLQRQGVRTHLLQRRDRIWSRLFDERESAIIEQQIRHEGIHIHYREEIASVQGRRGRVHSVLLESGRELPCQIVGVAIGVRPNLTLIRDQPVETDRGVLVDEHMRSNIPNVFAAGDVAQVYDRWTGGHYLDVLWPSAINEGRAAGHNMVDVAHGRSPQFTYQKGSPFNAALLFGVHLTVIGQIGGAREETVEETSFLSRGSSQVWTAPFASSYRSAWDSKGPNSVRITISEGRIIGALLMGDQQLADPLRQLVENEVDIIPYQEQLLHSEDALRQAIIEAWQAWRRRAVPT